MSTAEIFENGKEAFIIKPGDSDSIADYLTCLSNNDNLRKEISRRIYEKSFSYIYNKVLGEYLNLVFKCSERKMKDLSITDCKRL
jgi:glycosyltransferase involved in cell wall biosynthesis